MNAAKERMSKGNYLVLRVVRQVGGLGNIGLLAGLSQSYTQAIRRGLVVLHKIVERFECDPPCNEVVWACEKGGT